MFSLFPSGVLQVLDVMQHGYWQARSVDYTGTGIARPIEWMRMPGDLVFIVFGAVPLAIPWSRRRPEAGHHEPLDSMHCGSGG